MSSRAGSSFVTFLMSIPVAAAGMVAFFGVPPLSTVIAATRGLNSKFQNISSDDSEGSRSSSSQFEEWENDSAPSWDKEGTDESSLPDKPKHKPHDVDDLGFSKHSHDEPDDKSSHEDTDERKLSPSNGHSDSTRPKHLAWRDELIEPKNSKSPDSKRSSDSDDGNSNFRDASDKKSDSPLSMKEALKKLNSLGVKNYHLERGADQDTWLFVCLFSPGDDTRVIHRFEAESSEPEGAVSETLKQIDSWLLKRFRDKQPISQTAM